MCCRAHGLLVLYKEVLGHSDVSAIMIYTHVLNRSADAVKSPLDGMALAAAKPPGVREERHAAALRGRLFGKVRLLCVCLPVCPVAR